MADVIGIDEIMNDEDECLENVCGPYFIQCQSAVEVTVVVNLDCFQYSSSVRVFFCLHCLWCFTVRSVVQVPQVPSTWGDAILPIVCLHCIFMLLSSSVGIYWSLQWRLHHSPSMESCRQHLSSLDLVFWSSHSLGVVSVSHWIWRLSWPQFLCMLFGSSLTDLTCTVETALMVR